MTDHFAIPKPKLKEESSEINQYKKEIALFSLKKAALRVHSLKEYKSQIGPLKEDELLEEAVKQMKGFELAATEYADTISASRGVLSPDNKYLITCGWSGDCKVWTDFDKPRVVTQLVGQKYQVFDADFHPSVASNDPDLPNIVTGGADCIIRFWSFCLDEEKQDCLEIRGHEDRINRVKFHPNGLHIVSASYDKTAKVWDIEKEKELLVLKGHQNSINAMSIHQDGSLVVDFRY